MIPAKRNGRIAGGQLIQAFLFEAQQIQSYIFSTNKLRDASGASELINSICNEDVSGPVVSENGVGPRTVGAFFGVARIFRSTGGVLDFAVDATPDEMACFRAVFRLAVSRAAPGLAFSDGVGEGADEPDARKAARADSLVSRSVGGGAPFVSPLVRPAPRSGGVPAVMTGWTDNGRCVITKEFADLPTLAKRRFLKQGARELADQFLPRTVTAKEYDWPEVFSLDGETADGAAQQGKTGPAVFPFAGKYVKRIALIHADGNGVGRLFMEADKTLSPAQMRDLSRALAGAMRAAVQVAMGPVADAAVGGIVPARPILLGGDDVTLILRADLAVDFVTALIEAFQTQATAAVRKYLPQQPPLTLKAGVVILGPAQPFGQAHSLCGVLAGLAKAEISRVSLWRLTTSVMPRGKDDLDLQARCDGGTRLWSPSHAVADLQALQTLAGLMAEDDVGRGALRRVPELLKTDRAGAERTFKRAMVVLERRNGGIAARVRAALDMFGAGETGVGTGGYCPLLDAHDLAQVMPAPKAGAQP